MVGKVNSFLKNAFVYSSPYLLLLLIGVQVLASLGQSIDRAAYAYPRTVVMYGLVDVKTDLEVMTRIQKWKDDAWGAQVGALRVLCANDMQFVDSLMSNNNGSAICRVVK